ncbi:MAG: peptidoglycan bridge formation glycyltransferase FemA/FemB family protein [bacterium]|nr:peptidoglycan bridge formation glycyltransferase FemA/FemB family protein [bacterium]
MEIITLTETQFKNYAKIHSKRNFCQTVEYANMIEKRGFEKIYLGLLDDNNNLVASTMLLSQHLKAGFKYAYAPKGFLLDFNDKYLLIAWTRALKKFLSKSKIIFIKVDPLTLYQIYDSKTNLLDTNNDFLINMQELNYFHLGFNNNFESNFPRFNVVMYTDNDINSTYKTLRRSTKRNINFSSTMGISVHKGSAENVDLFYSMIRKKTEFDLDYFKDFFKFFNNNDNKFELYFAKINPKTYINNYQYLQEQEAKRNNILSNKLQTKNVRKTKKLLNKKMTSDNLLEKYKEELIKATKIHKNYPNGLVVASAAIIKNNREIYFIEEGHEEKVKDINACDILRWEIIKKHMKEGYKIFNLGGITGNFNKEDNPFYGLNFSKTGFGGNILEYPGEFDLVLNKPLYKLYYNVMYYKNKIEK